MSRRFLAVFSLLGLILSLGPGQPGFGAEPLTLEGPAFALTGLKGEITVGGLPEEPATVSYQILVNGQPVASGEKPTCDLKTLSVPFTTSGPATVKLIAGDREGVTTVRVISGWLSVLPPLIAIILALVTREVLVSLLIGAWIGATIVYDFNPLLGFLRALDKYLLEAMADPGHASIIIFSVTLGGMIGIVNRTGGMQGIVDLISRMVVGPKTAQLAAWIMGVVIFFDDYANTLIVGNSMRPITDANRVSREKLSYIVDSTSAPVAGIALLSTWVGYEIGLIRQAFVDLAIPETNFYAVFIQTIPFRFYCLLSLFFGFMICLTRKEFGPMHAAEVRARLEGKPLADGANPIATPEAAMPVLPAEMPKRWYNAAIPILAVIFGTLVGLVFHGGGFAPHHDLKAVSRQAGGPVQAQAIKVDHVLPDMGIIVAGTDAHPVAKFRYLPATTLDGEAGSATVKAFEGLAKGDHLYVESGPTTLTTSEIVRAAFGDANSQAVLIWVSIAGSIIALLLGVSQGLVSLEKGMQAWVNGARTMVLAMCVLLLAWSINGVCKDLRTADFLVANVQGVLQPWLVPALTFVIACLISFATGTSWGTMAILLPLSIPLSYNLNLAYYQEHLANQPGVLPMMDYIKQMLLVSIGAVLEGSIFGDHCSPISDTTIMSSMASGSDHIDHVRTQMPYALTVAACSIVLCYLPAGLGYSPWLCLPLSMVALVVALEVLGSDVPDIPAGAVAPSPQA
ncbi:MAG: Na+/H+ antiporter [Candidatus Ozemobacter sibiricus]|jgi:Na+/H+ antiporter NhaC|uniref:Na+/H+ antiporter n=1 Tax=Candidatus Ozemobacter sibiricus TaxID=2268124 RepID=A0A367ZR51_9BACT|nr:MAG: Na+/H+ antiporter [Candidatus Ozemobacter sibiricus]